MKIVEFIQASPANYTAGRGGRAIDGIAVDYTATSANVCNKLVYFSRSGVRASAHLFVDKDRTLRQSVRFEGTAWAVGDFAENQRTVSVEVISAGEDFTDAQVAALAGIWSYLVATYVVTRLLRHYDVTGKLCPARGAGEPLRRGSGRGEPDSVGRRFRIAGVFFRQLRRGGYRRADADGHSRRVRQRFGAP